MARVLFLDQYATLGGGQRILIDRLWPRGISKERAHLTEWLRELAPSHELRKWFGHEPARWDEFRRRYHHCHVESIDVIKSLLQRSEKRIGSVIRDARDCKDSAARIAREMIK